MGGLATVTPPGSAPSGSADPSVVAQPVAAPGAVSAATPTSVGPQTFDPSKPYQAPQLPQVSNLPSQASALDPNEPQPNGAANRGAGVAYILDKAMRSYMQGKAQSQAVSAIQLQKQSSALQGLYNEQGQKYLDLAKSGAPPEQIQQAQDQMNAAWQSYMKFMGQHVEGQEIDKKTGQPKPQKDNLLTRIFNPSDPAAVPAAVYEAYQKVGPPAMHEAAPYLTDQYRSQLLAQHQAQAGQVQGATDQAAIAHTNAMNEQRYQQLVTTPNRTDDQDAELERVTLATGKPGAGQLRAIDEISQNINDRLKAHIITPEQAIQEQAQLRARGSSAFPKPAALGTVSDYIHRVAAASGMEDKDITPAQEEALKARFGALGKQGSTTTTGSHWINRENPETGKMEAVQVQTSTSKSGTALPPMPRGLIEAPSSNVPNPIVPQGSGTAATHSAVQVHQQALADGNTPRQAAAKAHAAATAIQQSYPQPKILAVIPTNTPGKQSPDETKAYNDEKLAQANYMNAQKAAADPDKSAGDFALTSSFVHAHVGRVTQKEIDMVNNLGGAKMMWDGKTARIISGELSDRQRNMLLQSVAESAGTAHKQAQDYRDGKGGRNASGSVPPLANSTNSSPAAPAAQSHSDLGVVWATQ